ncbi:MAG: hypothetical protein KF822_13630 [Steroidobacteraceae bacterium]|nr:hypothetical protein [Steroidobacteraceae bacterium]
MNRIVTAVVIAALSAPAWAVGTASAIADEKATVEQGADRAAPQADAAAAGKKEFQPPPGFKPKKFGDKLLYCKKDASIGTRFRSEKCFDEAQMRDFILAQEQSNRDFDRARAVCATPSVCRSE